MWTGDWWWDTQEKLPNESGTIAPGIIASNQMQLSAFSGDKKAWPVYISIGNIGKSIHRKLSSQAFILLGYIPMCKLECFLKDKHSEKGYQFFHDCMRKILEPLKKAGRKGIVMTCADGYKRVHPLLAVYMADYPEQCLVCCRENSCPKCKVFPKQRGELLHSILARDPEETLNILQQQSAGLKPSNFSTQNLQPVDPFWCNLPHCNIFDCMTPNLLHQLQKGIFGDHISAWSQASIKKGSGEIDD
ncbi:hypothetical protein VKT23_020606 [Stygiomarasmius scandens]|uniref:Uncharacterized protein n=1 Tax=Marasmiellus scandens TaxID=2682957 RepID=A0ABR1IIP3_9AGAR